MMFQNKTDKRVSPTSFSPMKYGFYRNTLFWQFVKFYSFQFVYFTVECWYFNWKMFTNSKLSDLVLKHTLNIHKNNTDVIVMI